MGTEVKPDNPITRDFLGGFFAVESKELDLDLHVPIGWEKHLDLKSGKVYIQKCIQQSSSSNQATPYSKKGQDMNNDTSSFLSTSKPKTVTKSLNLFEDTTLKINPPISKLPSNLIGNCNNSTYQSVHTLDRVKSALDRASLYSKKRSSQSVLPSLSDNYDRTGSFVKQDLVVGACLKCLSYVLTSKINPKCPKCKSTIPVNVISFKKTKTDLNLSI